MASEMASTSSGTVSSNILVHPRQKNNPVLNFVKKVGYEFRDDLLADFVVGQSSCCLFLSLRYHQAQPHYIVKRLDDLRNLFTLRVLLVHVDIKDPPPILREINRMALQARVTLLLGWSVQEIGQYLEHYKILEHKPPELIKEKFPHGLFQPTEVYKRSVMALCALKSITKPDAVELLATFGCLQGVADASLQELAIVPGIGERKAKLLYDVMREPLVFS